MELIIRNFNVREGAMEVDVLSPLITKLLDCCRQTLHYCQDRNIVNFSLT